MRLYKVIPYANNVVLRKNELAQDAIVRYFEIINQECAGGWEFLNMFPINVTKNLGIMKNSTKTFSAFVFYKESKVENLDED